MRRPRSPGAIAAVPMTVAQVLRELRVRSGTRTGHAGRRQGPDATRAIGVDRRRLRHLAQRIGRDHQLALKLWDTGVDVARMLATLVDVPREATDAQLDHWVLTAGHAELADAVCMHVVLGSPLARAKVGDWKAHPQELARRCAYVVLSALARGDAWMTDADFTPHVDAIPSLIHREGPLVAEVMRQALVSVGGRNEALRARAAAAAARIRRASTGLVVFDRELGPRQALRGRLATSRRAG